MARFLFTLFLILGNWSATLAQPAFPYNEKAVPDGVTVAIRKVPYPTTPYSTRYLGKRYSPDGKWFLAWNRRGILLLREASGQRPPTILLPSSDHRVSNLLWLPDSQGWVELTFKHPSLQITVRSVQHPKLVQRFACPLPSAMKQGFDLMSCELLGFLPDGRCLAYVGSDFRAKPFFTFALAPQPQVKEYVFTPPAGWEVQGSPLWIGGKRLAWLLGASDSRRTLLVTTDGEGQSLQTVCQFVEQGKAVTSLQGWSSKEQCVSVFHQGQILSLPLE